MGGMKMDFQLFTGKNVEDALTKAVVALGVTSDKVEYEVLDKGSSGFIGIGSKPAKINARVKEEDVIVVSEAPADIEFCAISRILSESSLISPYILQGYQEYRLQ